ncbi:MAG: pseudouridine synthase [Spirochaetota bacterium]|nr:pseudouridine synthase [Spirochaetota bacterium]
MRINRYLSLCGLGSRRKVEDYILTKRIRVNGAIVEDLSFTVDTVNDIVELDRGRLNLIKKLHYLILNKPRGYITAMSDSRGRPIVMDMIPAIYKKERIFPVGRLDKDTEGLLLFTNDGDMAYKLSHPKYHVTKVYIVKLDKPLKKSHEYKIEKGIYLYNRKTYPSQIDTLDISRQTIRMGMMEGRKRQIRMTFQGFGYRVEGLKRIAFGPLGLSGIGSGQYRILTDREIKALKEIVQIHE